ncbi:MAG: response regulator [Kiritimatiellaeota bacterium]|nr:response regulator [Kiritimatiellota bacterium]
MGAYRMAEELRVSELRYRRLFETSKDGILILDADSGMIMDVNPFLGELLQMSHENLLGKKPWGLDFFKDIIANEAKFKELQAKESIRYADLPLKTSDGRKLDVEFVSNLYLVNDRRMIQCNIRDITAVKRAEVEKVQREVQTRQLQKAESLGRMAGAIAHHFNNKLQVVIGNLDMAMVEKPRDPQVAVSLRDAMNSAREAAKLSGLMLTYLGQAPRDSKPLDLAEVCRQSLPLLRSALPVVLETELATPGPVIEANANQIQQLLTNLVTNAWEASGVNRGSIRLSVTTVAAKEISAAYRYPVEWQPQGPTYACLSVMDSGSGIADADIEKVFDPFFSRKFVGRGLGLPVVLGILRMHNGCISVESEPGLGSTFRVYFPTLPHTSIPPPQVVGPRCELVAGGTLLVVDDEEMVRKLATTMLTHLGFSVLTAADGVEAEAVFRQHQADIRCVLTDLTMPRMDGWAIITALRTLRADLPVIMASGYEVTSEMVREHPDQPDAFLTKPYTLQQLHDTLGHVLAPHQETLSATTV